MSGRIPQRFIDDLLDRVDIVDVVGARLDLRKTGKNHSARCPFHDEKTPSFSVNSEKQFYYCFGCGAGGNALGFVMDYDRIDFPRAVENLASLVGMEVPTEGTRDTEQDNRRKELYAALEIADQFYREQLRNKDTSEAIEYLRHRGLSGEVARDFGLGFAPKAWDKVLNLAGNDDKKVEQFTAAGLLVLRDEGGKIYDRFRHRIMFPIRDSRGRTVAFGGRVLGDDKPKYLNSPETPVFHKGRELYGLYEASRAGKNLSNLIVVEGYMDVVALAQYGITNAVATLGTATSIEHLEKIFRYTSEVVFCFDGDSAGRKAARRAMETCLPTISDGRSARFLFLPEGEDPDTLVREIGAEAFNKLVVDATPLSAFLFEAMTGDLKLDTPDDRAKLSQLMAPLIARLPRGVFHQLMIEQLADVTGLASTTLEKLIVEPENSPAPWSDAPPESYQDQAPPLDEPYQRPNLAPLPEKRVKLAPAHWLIGILAHHPHLTKTLEKEHIEQLSELSAPGMEILMPLIDLLLENPDYTLNHLLGYWRGIHGQEQGEQLANIINNDLITSPGQSEEASQCQLDEILAGLLRTVGKELPVKQQIERLTRATPLNEEDRKTAVELWHQLSAQGGEESSIIDIKQLLNEKFSAEE